MWLAIDAGNTRVKWALFDDDKPPTKTGSANKNALAALAKAAHRREVWVSAVNAVNLQKTLANAHSVVYVKSRAVACGITNRYRPPNALGVDRWLALLAVRRRYSRAIVVSAGTAITIDGFDENGVFDGGMILPGLALMLSGVSRATTLPAVVATVPHKLTTPPNNTEAALLYGALAAAAGAVREFRRRFFPNAPILLTGGDAEKLLPLLPSAKHTPDLVLHGIAKLRAAGG